MTTTGIEWADEVWNPVTGCTPISPGCEHCYAARMAKRLAGRCGYDADDPFKITVRPERLAEPFRWRKRKRVFVCSMGDLFHPRVSDEFICAVFGAMSFAGEHTFMVLTKRPRAMRTWFAAYGLADCQSEFLSRDRYADAIEAEERRARHTQYMKSSGSRNRWRRLHDRAINGAGGNEWPLPNAWLGVTVEDQRRAEKRIPQLLATPAAIRFVSCEPLLGAVYLDEYYGTDESICPGIGWVIVGGETGPGWRQMKLDWACDLADGCLMADVPFFMKRLAGGGRPPKELRIHQFPKEPMT